MLVRTASEERRMRTLAYIDIGSGSLLAQLIVGGLAGVATFAKFRWHQIRGAFSRKPKADKA